MHVHTCAVDEHHPLVFADFLGIDAHADALAAEDVGAVLDEPGVLDSLGIDGNLICTGTERLPNIVYGLDAAAHGQRYENLFRRLPYHVQHDTSALIGSSDVVKHDLVCALLIVSIGTLHRIADIFDSLKVYALYHLAVAHIQTRNDSFCQHMRYTPSARAMASLKSSVPL